MSNDLFVINAELREDEGKGASRRLRREDKVPAILYGDDKKPQPLTLKHSEVIAHLENEAFYSHILTLVANGKKQRAILRDIQRHAYKPKVLHMDFQRVNSRVEIHMNVPLHFINEETCVGFKAGGIVSHQMNEIEITCLPKDLPEFIEVDIQDLDRGESIHISEIALPKGVASVALSHGEEHDLPVVSILNRGGADEAADEEGAPEAVEVPTVSDEEKSESED
jgi:large subunit ribosomal protein L25